MAKRKKSSSDVSSSSNEDEDWQESGKSHEKSKSKQRAKKLSEKEKEENEIEDKDQGEVTKDLNDENIIENEKDQRQLAGKNEKESELFPQSEKLNLAGKMEMSQIETSRNQVKPTSSLHTIKMGDYVILTTLLGKKINKLAKLEDKGDVYLKKQRINIRTLIGAEFNSIHRFDQRTRSLQNADLSQEQLREILNVSSNFTELNFDDASKDNRTVMDDGLAQKLDRDDIESLKNKGASGDDIIRTLVENSKTFKDRNVFSQEKYLKKKQEKYSNLIRVLKPTPSLLAEMYYSQGPMKINNLRLDSLAQMLTACNVRSGAKYMVIDTNMGLLTAAILDRLVGDGSSLNFCQDRDYGKCVQIFLDDAPVSSYRQSVDALNLSPEIHERCLSSINIRKLNVWSKSIDSESTEVEMDTTKEDVINLQSRDESLNDENVNKKSEEKVKRRATRIREENDAMNTLGNKDMDGLLIVTRNHDPTNLLTFLLKFLSIAQPFAVFSPSMGPLVSCYQSLKGCAINVRVTETWFRHYQVLDSRTRPEMNMSGSGGYLLTGIKVQP